MASSKRRRVIGSVLRFANLDLLKTLADAVEALFPEPMADLSHFANGDRRECLAEKNTETEARATLAEGLRWLKEERSAGRLDLSWLPEEVRTELAGRRMKAVEAWGAPSMP